MSSRPYPKPQGSSKVFDRPTVGTHAGNMQRVKDKRAEVKRERASRVHPGLNPPKGR